MWDGQLQTKNQIGVVTCKMCFLFTLVHEIHDIHYMECFIMEKLESLLYSILH